MLCSGRVFYSISVVYSILESSGKWPWRLGPSIQTLLASGSQKQRPFGRPITCPVECCILDMWFSYGVQWWWKEPLLCSVKKRHSFWLPWPDDLDNIYTTPLIRYYIQKEQIVKKCEQQFSVCGASAVDVYGGAYTHGKRWASYHMCGQRQPDSFLSPDFISFRF